MERHPEAEAKAELAARMFGELETILRYLGIHTICAVYAIPTTETHGLYALYCTDQTLEDPITQGVKGLLEIKNGEGLFHRVTKP